MSVQEIVGYNGDEGSFEICKPNRGKLSEKEFKGVHERGLQVPEWKVKRGGVAAYFGADGDTRKGVVGGDVDFVVREGMERGDK